MSSASHPDHPVIPPAAPHAGVGASHISLRSYNASAIRRKLLEHRESLFSKHNGIKFWIPGAGTGTGLRTDPPGLPEPAGDMFYVIRQDNPWDRLRVTSDFFDSLADTLGVFPFFLESVLRFDIESQDDNNTWHGFHSRRRLTDRGDVETCYMLHFFENNGSTEGDPWSPRQTAVYHRHYASGDQSSWILINPSAHLKESVLADPEGVSRLTLPGKSSAARFHVLFTNSALRNWPDYIAAQRTKVEEFEAKTFFSEADHIQPEADYDVRFQDRQNLQQLKQGLRRAVAMLDATTDLQARIRVFLDRDADGDALRDAITVELDDFDAEAKYYRRCISDLQQRASDTMSLFLDTLNRRYGHANLRSAADNESSPETNSASLSTTTSSTAVSEETEHKREQRTAENIRSLTRIASVYLPITVLSGIWSLYRVDEGPSARLCFGSRFWGFLLACLLVAQVLLLIIAARFAAYEEKEREKRRERTVDAAARDADVVSP